MRKHIQLLKHIENISLGVLFVEYMCLSHSTDIYLELALSGPVPGLEDVMRKRLTYFKRERKKHVDQRMCAKVLYHD